MGDKIKNWFFPVSPSRRRGIDLMKNPKFGRRIILASTNIKSNKAVIVKINGKYHKVRELGVARFL
jgi:spore germination protein GerM